MKAIIDIPRTKVTSAVIELPISSEYIGQKVEIVYEIRRVPREEKKIHFSNFGLDAQNYKFDREEANAR
ncbi:hypothetical protein R83H12_02277 [Fibrobacteria bacterium R8-3-H12]